MPILSELVNISTESQIKNGHEINGVWWAEAPGLEHCVRIKALVKSSCLIGSLLSVPYTCTCMYLVKDCNNINCLFVVTT